MEWQTEGSEHHHKGERTQQTSGPRRQRKQLHEQPKHIPKKANIGGQKRGKVREHQDGQRRQRRHGRPHHDQKFGKGQEKAIVALRCAHTGEGLRLVTGPRSWRRNSQQSYIDSLTPARERKKGAPRGWCWEGLWGWGAPVGPFASQQSVHPQPFPLKQGWRPDENSPQQAQWRPPPRQRKLECQWAPH